MVCAVEDAGCGIEAGDLPHIFQPFFRAADARARGSAGVGLGLAVAQRIATAFAGTLEVRSRHEQGSCFTLRLPETPAALLPEGRPTSRESAQDSSDSALSAALADNNGSHGRRSL